MSTRRPVVFITTPHIDAWSGAEVLWSQTAIELASQGFPISASVWEGSLQHPRIRELKAHGVDLWPWRRWSSLRTAFTDRTGWVKHPWKRLKSGRNGALFTAERLLDARRPAIAILSDGGTLPPIELLELCVAKRIPFVTINHAGSEAVCYDDDLAKRYRVALTAALRCFFVAHANRWLAEKQIGGELANAEVVRNPFNVSYDASFPWPPSETGVEIRFACVGRLYPPAKGQDILFEAFTQSQWKCRNWRLSIYGEGSTRLSLEWLARRLGLSDRVNFAGLAKPEEIWAQNHVLVMPSRYEGLPLVMVEAMLCSRPIVATDVAGHAEIVEDGVTGFLADAATPRAIAAALERFWARRIEAEEIGKAGRHRIQQLFSPNPARDFAETLKGLGGLMAASSRGVSINLTKG